MRQIDVEISLLRQIMLDSIGCDLGAHYQNGMANTVSTYRAHKTIITHTGYRKRTKCLHVIYNSEDRSGGLTGAVEIANGFRDKFAENHGLSGRVRSRFDEPVREFVHEISQPAIGMPFGAGISAAIDDWNDLAEADERLPVGLRGVLTCASEVAEIIAVVPPKKSARVDSMPYFLMKHFSPSVPIFLTILFNHLLSNSYFPAAWKHYLVTPIPKPNKDPSNLNCVSKIFLEPSFVNSISLDS